MAICNCHEFFPGTFVKVYVNLLDFFPKIFRIRENLSSLRMSFPHVLSINRVNLFKAKSLVKTVPRAI